MMKHMNLFSMMLNRIKKIKVETPDPCFGGTGHHAFYTITKVTPSAVYLRYDGCEESQTIKVKR